MIHLLNKHVFSAYYILCYGLGILGMVAYKGNLLQSLISENVITVWDTGAHAKVWKEKRQLNEILKKIVIYLYFGVVINHYLNNLKLEK